MISSKAGHVSVNHWARSASRTFGRLPVGILRSDYDRTRRNRSCLRIQVAKSSSAGITLPGAWSRRQCNRTLRNLISDYSQRIKFRSCECEVSSARAHRLRLHNASFVAVAKCPSSNASRKTYTAVRLFIGNGIPTTAATSLHRMASPNAIQLGHREPKIMLKTAEIMVALVD